MDTLFAHSSLIHTPSYIKSPHLGWDWSQMLTLLTLALNWELSLILSEPSVICHVYHCLDNILNIKHEKHLRIIPCSIICFQVFKMKAHTDLLSKLCLDCNVLTVLVTSDLYLGCVKRLVLDWHVEAMHSELSTKLHGFNPKENCSIYLLDLLPKLRRLDWSLTPQLFQQQWWLHVVTEDDFMLSWR